MSKKKNVVEEKKKISQIINKKKKNYTKIFRSISKTCFHTNSISTGNHQKTI